ncbi:MAG: hypothetical protein EHM60_08630 [Lysobacterales bacterium]|nr:MAG: hypothetical protein EHM60_08630 [Xanthomonadales bacterium]
MAKLVLILAVLGLGYWYWSGSRQPPAELIESARLEENAAIMQQCINQEQRMQSAGGLGGLGDVGASGADAERLCAEKNGLVKRDGQWHRR